MGSPSLLQNACAISRIAANIKVPRSRWRNGGYGWSNGGMASTCTMCHCPLLQLPGPRQHSSRLNCGLKSRRSEGSKRNALKEISHEHFSQFPEGVCQPKVVVGNFYHNSCSAERRGVNNSNQSFHSQVRSVSRAAGHVAVDKVNGIELATAAKVTPHIPVLLEEILSFFRGQKLSTFVDGTLGAGGHSAAIIREHPELQTLVGLDVDPRAHLEARPNLSAAIQATHGTPTCTVDSAIKDKHSASVGGPKLHILQANFHDFRHVLEKTDPPLLREGVDGFLLDLGMSSMQVDDAERGFSFIRDGPVDMRMNPEGPLSAEDIVNEWSEAEIGRILMEYGEERRWRYLAQRIVEARGQERITSTLQLVRIIGGRKTGNGLHPATRTFQALRIAVNDELGAIARTIPVALEALAQGGRLGVISFHSLEDRIVKRAFLTAAGKEQPADEWGWGGGASTTRKNKYAPKHGRARLHEVEDPLLSLVNGKEGPLDGIVASTQGPQFKILTKRPVVATDDEIARNSRSRSAKLRFIERVF